MIYTTEKRSRFNKKKEELEFYWVVLSSWHTIEKKWFKTSVQFHKQYEGELIFYGIRHGAYIKPYEFSTAEKAEQYIKDIQSL